jgi:hypothetical protein
MVPHLPVRTCIDYRLSVCLVTSTSLPKLPRNSLGRFRVNVIVNRGSSKQHEPQKKFDYVHSPASAATPTDA